MCPSCNGDLPVTSNAPTVPSSVNGTSAAPQTNGVSSHEQDGHEPHNPTRQPMYLQDYLSNVSNFKVRPEKSERWRNKVDESVDY